MRTDEVTSRNPSAMREDKPPEPARQTASAPERAHYVTAMPPLALLEEHLASLDRVLLGYSGGVDSGLLAVAGRRALGRDRFLAVIGKSASYPAAQWIAAVALARRFDVPLLELETRELDDPRYVENTPDRC